MEIIPRSEGALEKQAPRSCSRLPSRLGEHLEQDLEVGASELEGGADALVHESDGHRPIERAKIREKGHQRGVLLSLRA